MPTASSGLEEERVGVWQWKANGLLSHVAGQWRVWTVSIPFVYSILPLDCFEISLFCLLPAVLRTVRDLVVSCGLPLSAFLQNLRTLPLVPSLSRP